MKNLTLVSIGAIGLLMFDSSDARAGQLGALLTSGSIFGLLDDGGAG